MGLASFNYRQSFFRQCHQADTDNGHVLTCQGRCSFSFPPLNSEVQTLTCEVEWSQAHSLRLYLHGLFTFTSLVLLHLLPL